MNKLILLAIFLSHSLCVADTITFSLPKMTGNKEAVGISVKEDKIFLHEAHIDSSSESTNLSFERKSENVLSTGVVFSDTAQQSASLLSATTENIPQCEDSIDQKTISQTQPALMQALVQVRAEKRELLKQKITDLLQGDFLQKLQQLESGFGLNVGAPISADISPYELSERISLLALVMGNVETKTPAK